jgi:hypothetical protein
MRENHFMASGDRDKPSAELLRRSLASPSGAADDCPGPETLAAYFERSLDASEIASYERHLSECGRCREELAAMVRAGEPVAAEPERTSGSSWLWGWRRLAPALAVFVIMAGIWYLQRTGHFASPGSDQQPLVAMSPPTEPPIAAVPPESAPEPNALARVAPPPAAPKAKQAEKSPALIENKKAVTDQLENSRDSAQMDSPAKTPSAPKAATPPPAENSAPPPSVSQSVEVTAASPLPEAPSARIRAAPQMEMSHAAPNVQPNGQASGVTGGAISGAFSAGSGIAGNKQMTARAVPSRATGQNQAVTLEATDESSSQKLIHTPNPQVLWRIAGGGFVERSIDGGAVWQGQLPNPDAQLLAGAAPTPQICWFVGRNGIILLTADGTTWKTIQPPATADFVGVTAKDASSATVTAADGRKFMTADGGKRWNPAP